MSSTSGEIRAALDVEGVLAESTKYDGGWRHQCGEDLLGATVAHSVHDGPFPLSGSGRVQHQTVPYCPQCHEKPSFYGGFIRPGDKDWPRVTIKRKQHSDGSITNGTG